MFGLIMKICIGLLTGLVNRWNHTKYVLLSHQKCVSQPALINLHPNKYSEEFPYYPCAPKLDKCVWILKHLMTYLIKYVFQIKQKI